MQETTPLLTALIEYSRDDIACFDVPGHKRGAGVPLLCENFGEQIMRIDTNSGPKLDNVANPQGVIKASQALMAQAFGAEHAFFLTTGTTTAIHVMIMSSLQPGEKILLPRNIHKSAVNALILSGAIPVYVAPNVNQVTGVTENITLAAVQAAYQEHPDLKAVFLLNPTYYGFVSELTAIVQYCHKQSLLVLVDEAHGSHFHFHQELPMSAMAAGADLSSISVHKTGGALTQASALLVQGPRVSAAKIQKTINLLQTTSASYLLMGSLDGARQSLACTGEQQLTKTLAFARYAREKINALPGLQCIQSEAEQRCDETKLGIYVRELGMTGFEVYDYFWQVEKIQLELADLDSVLAIFSLGETQAHVERLIAAFERLAKRQQPQTVAKIQLPILQTEVVMSPRAAYYADKVAVPLTQAEGEISGESILAYPPGIPIIAPGERITAATLAYLHMLQQQGAYLTDHHDPELQTILVIKEL